MSESMPDGFVSTCTTCKSSTKSKSERGRTKARQRDVVLALNPGTKPVVFALYFFSSRMPHLDNEPGQFLQCHSPSFGFCRGVWHLPSTTPAVCAAFLWHIPCENPRILTEDLGGIEWGTLTALPGPGFRNMNQKQSVQNAWTILDQCWNGSRAALTKRPKQYNLSSLNLRYSSFFHHFSQIDSKLPLQHQLACGQGFLHVLVQQRWTMPILGPPRTSANGGCAAMSQKDSTKRSKNLQKTTTKLLLGDRTQLNYELQKWVPRATTFLPLLLPAAWQKSTQVIKLEQHGAAVCSRGLSSGDWCQGDL